MHFTVCFKFNHSNYLDFLEVHNHSVLIKWNLGNLETYLKKLA